MKSLLNMLKSILYAVLGVRKSSDAEDDFAQFDYRWYVVLGFAVAIVIIILLILLVKVVMSL